MKIKPIETRYAGCRLRSRLEARWAVFFDHLGVRWEYEPQGFETPHGRYLPDFLLRLRTPTWFEVKNEEHQETDHETNLWEFVADMTDTRLVVAFGMLDPRAIGCAGDDDVIRDGRIQLRGPGWDTTYAFTVCCTCDEPGIEFDARGARVCGNRHRSEGYGCGHGNSDRCHAGNDERIIKAYNAARSARFEFGESGA